MASILSSEVIQILHLRTVLASSLHLSLRVSRSCQLQPHISREASVAPQCLNGFPTQECMSTIFPFRQIFCLGTPQLSVAQLQGQAAEPQLPRTHPPTQPCLGFPANHHFLVSSPCGKNNFPLKCLNLYVILPTFLACQGMNSDSTAE
jgi:hypothetical protein